jgi:hypothetical protein
MALIAFLSGNSDKDLKQKTVSQLQKKEMLSLASPFLNMINNYLSKRY